jgi:regulator of protease activity HflC (stomatin/prohibitin superfamily)
MNTTTQEVIVPESFVGLLYEDGAFRNVVAPGKVKLKRGFFDDVKRVVTLVDMRERSLTIKGQEILTADKVAIRVSLLVYYRVTDAPSAVHAVASYEERIYEDVQLAARRFLASRALDAILTDRNEISDAVRVDVRGTAARYGVEILRADVKDLVFPGNLREIMNQVLEVERKAEAKLLQAKKEAETQKVVADAANERAVLRLEAEREQTRLRAEAAQEVSRIKLAAEVDDARAIEEHPSLLRLREIQALGDIAKAGGKFVVGLHGDTLAISRD